MRNLRELMRSWHTYPMHHLRKTSDCKDPWILHDQRLEEGWFIWRIVNYFDAKDSLSSTDLATQHSPVSHRVDIEALCRKVHGKTLWNPRTNGSTTTVLSKDAKRVTSPLMELRRSLELFVLPRKRKSSFLAGFLTSYSAATIALSVVASQERLHNYCTPCRILTPCR